MKNKQEGISLIVLIVTIIVIIILASAVILTLSKNNPIERAREAKFKEDIRNFQDELAMYISKDYASKSGARDEKITATKYTAAGDLTSVYTYIPSFSKEYEGKLFIEKDELKYNDEMISEKELQWCKSLDLKANTKTGAQKAKLQPDDFYGSRVNYTAPNGVNDWKIFYSDGVNVYIITSDYVDPRVDNQLPDKNGAKPASTSSKAATFSNRTVFSKYNGSSNVTDEKIKALNSDFFEKGYTSSTYGFKSVAYLLDSNIWSALYVDSTVAEYAIGGPSVEMVVKSYSEKIGVDYRAQAVSSVGYQVSNNAGASYSNSISGVLSSEDLYFLPQNKGADSMWLSSPSVSNGDHLMCLKYNGELGYNTCTSSQGFRPIVCLNSDVLLRKNQSTDIYEIN